jgi:predicted anti-sigma-YlaC factor YlaD
MNKITCEQAIISRLADLDGEESDISIEQITAHMADCGVCREEFEQMQSTVMLLKKQKRRQQDANLWTAIEGRIESKSQPLTEMRWQIFLLLGLFLVGYKILEIYPETDFGLLFKLTPVLMVTVLFLLVKENPFRIKTEFTSER